MLRTPRFGGGQDTAGSWNFSAAPVDGRNEEVDGHRFAAGTHTSEFRTAVAAVPTTGFTIFQPSTIDGVSPPTI